MAKKKTGVAEYVPMIAGSEEVPPDFRLIYLELVSLTDEFCNERLDTQYQGLCREAAIGLCQSGSPVVRGKRASWASGIVYSVGRVNFLSDPSFEPYVRSEEIAEWFGVSIATMHNKAKIIREGLDMGQLDPNWTLPSRLADNPFIWMIEVDGFIVDLRSLPREIQQAAFEDGIIPFVHADGPPQSTPYAVSHERSSRNNKKNSGAEGTQTIYQLKIALDRIRPPIWRRVQVADCTLEELHDIVQDAMGWEDCHLHEFSVDEERFTSAGMDECGDLGAPYEWNVTLGELVAAGHKKLKYWYDFGDDWWHTITVEKTLSPEKGKTYPVCTTGKRACPPEDIGGPWGYVGFLEAIADPKHDRHEELSDWFGGDFDPEEFNLEEVNETLLEGR